MKIEPELLYSDADIAVVNKPAGWLSIPDRFDATKPNVLGWLRQKFESVFIVHRIDRETSGVIIFALNEHAHRHLSMQFEHHKAVKIYVALAEGVIQQDEGEIIAPIGDDPAIGGRMKISALGKFAHTRWRVLERFRRFTLTEAMILTGRMHQIRVHFRHMDHPLAVDGMYGPRHALMMSEVKGKKYKLGKWVEEELPIMGRTTLHAARLRVVHPKTEVEMTFEAPPPKDFRALLTQLRRWDADKPAPQE